LSHVDFALSKAIVDGVPGQFRGAGSVLVLERRPFSGLLPHHTEFFPVGFDFSLCVLTKEDTQHRRKASLFHFALFFTAQQLSAGLTTQIFLIMGRLS